MTQIMLDVTTASVPELREAAKFITACANLRDGTDTNPLQLLDDKTANGPVAAPVAVAPTPPPAPLVAVDSTTKPLAVDTVYDSTGMPWDDRIHQSGKGQKKTGEWKLKKGIDLAVVEVVTKELSARKLVTAAPAAAVAEAPAAAPPPPPVSLPPAPIPAPPPTPAVEPVAVPATPAAAPISGYRALLAKIVTATKSGKITQDEVTAIVTKHGAPSIAMLNSLAHLIPAVEQDLDIMLIERA